MRFFSGLGEIFDYISKTVVFIVLSVLCGVLAFAYTFFSKDLVKPSGFIQVLEFIFKHADDYALSLLTGIIALVLVIVLVITAIWNTGKFILGDSEDNNLELITKIILAITTIIISAIYLSGLFGLAFATFVIAFVIIGLTKSN